MRFFKSALSAAALATLVALPAAAAGQSQKPSASVKKYVVPRTPWGDPDLQGNFTDKNEANTPLERPDEWAGRQIKDISDKELAEAVAQRQLDQVRRYENIIGVPIHWIDRLDAQNSRPWFVTDPPDGKIPPHNDEGRRRAEAGAAERAKRGSADSFVDRTLGDRCIVSFAAGPAVAEILPKTYGNSFQILQTKDYVAIRYEMVHETRIIPLEGRGAARPHNGPGLRAWWGDALARWDGSTLVVETTNFNGKAPWQGSTDSLRTVERFTRVAPNRIEFTATLEDPKTWVRPWSFALPLAEDDGQPIFEYACHEGNYALRNILAGARADEKAGRKVDRPAVPEE